MCRVLKGCRPGLRPEPFAEPLEASLKPLLFAAVALPLAWYHWRGRHSVPLPMPPALQAEKRCLEAFFSERPRRSTFPSPPHDCERTRSVNEVPKTVSLCQKRAKTSEIATSARIKQQSYLFGFKQTSQTFQDNSNGSLASAKRGKTRQWSSIPSPKLWAACAHLPREALWPLATTSRAPRRSCR